MVIRQCPPMSQLQSYASLNCILMKKVVCLSPFTVTRVNPARSFHVLRAYRLEEVTANQGVDPLTLDDDCKAIICTLLSDMVQD